MKFRYQLERFAFWVVRKFARIIPRNSFLALGRYFGRLAYQLDARHRRIAVENFRAAFPDSDGQRADETIRKCYEFFSAYLFDMLTCFPGLDMSKRARDFDIEGIEYLESAYQRGKGIILYGGHFGVWELMALVHGAKGWPLELVVRPLDNPYLESLLQQLRRSTGNVIIDKNMGFRPMLKALRAGKGIAVLMDQNVSTQDRVFVEFFGRPASTTPSVALLKLKTEATLMCVSSYPLPGNRYRLVYGPPLELPLTGNRPEDVRRITQACNHQIENAIRLHPECWLWMHRRWKTQPEPVLA
jgi:KDO2-lipid IV(A) lauroyltransferase